eukprot:jgi/Antlo1/2434/2573
MDEETAEAALSLLKLKYTTREVCQGDISGGKAGDNEGFLRVLFDICRHPSTDTIENVAILLRLTPGSVGAWFQNMESSRNTQSRLPSPSWIRAAASPQDESRLVEDGQDGRRHIASQHLLALYSLFFDTETE